MESSGSAASGSGEPPDPQNIISPGDGNVKPEERKETDEKPG